MDRFLLYSSHGHITGGELGERLGIPHGRQMPDERVDYLIRWGNSDRIRYVPRRRTWNRRSAIAGNTRKLNSLRVMRNAGIPVPEFNEDPDSHLSFPLVGRNSNHMGGRDIQVYHQPRDLQVYGPRNYYLEYIPKRLEYRVHVMDNQVIKISQKILSEPDDYDPIVWNYDTGFTFRNPREQHPGIYMAIPAVNALDLDFGAVDLIIGEDNEPYILEINTAPGLDEPSLELYTEKLANLVDLTL